MNYLGALLAQNAIYDKSTAVRLIFEAGDGVNIDQNAVFAMRNYDDGVLLRCDVANCNGMMQMAYSTEGLISLSSALSRFTAETFAATLGNLLSALINIREHGLMHCECVLTDFDRIYLRGADIRPLLVYLPIEGDRAPGAEERFIESLCDGIALAIGYNRSLTGALSNRLQKVIQGQEVTLEKLIAAVEPRAAEPRVTETDRHLTAAKASSERAEAQTRVYEPSTASWCEQSAQEMVDRANRFTGNLSANRPEPRRIADADQPTGVLCELCEDELYVLRGSRVGDGGEPLSELVTLPVRLGSTIIGRGNSGTDVRIAVSVNVSRVHCRLDCEKGRRPDQSRLFVTDIGLTSDGQKGSRNGTYLNNHKKPLKYGKRYELSDGDRLRLADVLLVVQKRKK